MRDNDGNFRPSYEHYLDAKRPRGRGVKTRLCSDDIGLLKEHLNSFVTCGAGTCVVCGQRCFSKCSICQLHCCWKAESAHCLVSCSVDLHDDNYFGLCLPERRELFGEVKRSFKKALVKDWKLNKKHIQGLRCRYHAEYEK